MKIVKRFLLGLLILILITTVIYYPKLQNVWTTMHFFDQDKIVHNFTKVNQMWQTRNMERALEPFIFPKKDGFQLPESFVFDGEDVMSQQYLDSSYTTGFLVIKNDTLLYEKYFLGHTDTTRHISWSVAKSYISALFGIAIHEGYIKSIDQNVEEYLPELKGTGYEGVKIKDVLQMSTGVKFNEDYFDFFSDINRWGRYFAWGASQDAFAATLINERPPGTYHHYVSINTHVLGMLLVKATGKSISTYMEEKLWKKIGAEHDGYWLVDDYGMEMALGGLNVTLRDYAKIGQLFLHEGNWQGEQLVPALWVKASTTPDAPHLQPGENPNSAHSFGYGYQWWIPESSQGEFLALGVYNQFIYINPTTKTVIVKNSANHNYGVKNVYSKSDAALAFFRAISEQEM